MRIVTGLAVLAVASAATAQAPAGAPQILVSASGTARTPPDMATVGFTLRGEGATSDEAVARLRDGAKAMSAGIAGLLGKASDYHSSQFSIAQVRSRDCDANPYGQQRLSTGICAVIGYVATMPVAVDTPRVQDDGTLVGLVGRLGGVDATVRGFWLRDASAAKRRAMQLALANARDQARLIAEGSGALLGPLVRVQDPEYREIALEQVAAAAGAAMPAPPPPPPPPPPIRVDLAPEPIDTTVRLMVAYAIDR